MRVRASRSGDAGTRGSVREGETLTARERARRRTRANVFENVSRAARANATRASSRTRNRRAGASSARHTRRRGWVRRRRATVRRRAVRAIARGPRSRRARARVARSLRREKDPRRATDGATALNLPEARGASRATFGAYAPKDHHVSLDEFSLDDDDDANDVRGAVVARTLLAPAPTEVSDREGSPPPLTPARRGELRDRDIPESRIESAPGGPSSSRAPVPATFLRETSAAAPAPPLPPRPPSLSSLERVDPSATRPPRRASSSPRVRETPRRGPNPRRSAGRSSPDENPGPSRRRRLLRRRRRRGRGTGRRRPPPRSSSSLALADPASPPTRGDVPLVPGAEILREPDPAETREGDGAGSVDPVDDGRDWTVAGEAMLVHARSLRDRAETLSHAAALAVIDAQTCANELMFLCAPSVRWEIDDAREETLRVLEECERAFGPADDDDSPPPSPPRTRSRDRGVARNVHARRGKEGRSATRRDGGGGGVRGGGTRVGSGTGRARLIRGVFRRAGQNKRPRDAQRGYESTRRFQFRVCVCATCDCSCVFSSSVRGRLRSFEVASSPRDDGGDGGRRRLSAPPTRISTKSLPARRSSPSPLLETPPRWTSRVHPPVGTLPPRDRTSAGRRRVRVSRRPARRTRGGQASRASPTRRNQPPASPPIASRSFPSAAWRAIEASET